jgi:hypothetical protein
METGSSSKENKSKNYSNKPNLDLDNFFTSKMRKALRLSKQAEKVKRKEILRKVTLALKNI